MYVIQTDQTLRAMRALLHFDTTSITTTGQMSSILFAGRYRCAILRLCRRETFGRCGVDRIGYSSAQVMTLCVTFCSVFL